MRFVGLRQRLLAQAGGQDRLRNGLVYNFYLVTDSPKSEDSLSGRSWHLHARLHDFRMRADAGGNDHVE
jgi:hypothetical protein